jgi:hypothetical protein
MRIANGFANELVSTRRFQTKRDRSRPRRKPNKTAPFRTETYRTGWSPAHFKTGAFNRSATPPSSILYAFRETLFVWCLLCAHYFRK